MVYQGRRKQFYIGQAESVGLLNVLKMKLSIRHNQYARHANIRGLGACLFKKILKNRYSEIEFGGISGFI